MWNMGKPRGGDPPLWLCLTVALCIGVTAWVKRPDLRPDSMEAGPANIIVYVVVLVAVISQVVWFALFSGHRLLVAPGTGWIAAGGCGAGGRLVGGGGAFGRHGPELSPAWDCQSGSAAGFTRPARGRCGG